MAESDNIMVFLSQCGPDQLPVRNELAQVLKSAGMSVIPEHSLIETSTDSTLLSLLASSACSVHSPFRDYVAETGYGPNKRRKQGVTKG